MGIFVGVGLAVVCGVTLVTGFWDLTTDPEVVGMRIGMISVLAVIPLALGGFLFGIRQRVFGTLLGLGAVCGLSLLGAAPLILSLLK